LSRGHDKNIEKTYRYEYKNEKLGKLKVKMAETAEMVAKAVMAETAVIACELENDKSNDDFLATGVLGKFQECRFASVKWQKGLRIAKRGVKEQR